MKKFDITQTNEFKSAQQFSMSSGIPMHPLTKPVTKVSNQLGNATIPQETIQEHVFHNTLSGLSSVNLGTHEVDTFNQSTQTLDNLPNNAVKRFIPQFNVSNQCIVPPGYDITKLPGAGIQKEYTDDKGKVRYWDILDSPIVITAIYEGQYGISDEKVGLEFYVPATNEVKSIIIDRETLSKPSSITALNRYGYKVSHTGRNSEAFNLIEYLKQYERVNYFLIPRYKASRKLGWNPKLTTFLPYSQSVKLVPEGPEEKKLAENGFVTKGENLDKYISEIKKILPESPVATFVYAMSFASPLLKIIDSPSFSVELARNSGHGKSVCQRLAMGVWGNPNKLVYSWKATPYAIEHFLDFTDDLPTCLEDCQNNKDVDFITDVFYMVFNGTGKIRGNKKGGNQVTLTFSGILISSTEEESEHRINIDGIRRRLITLVDKPFPNKKTAKKIAKAIDRLHTEIHGLAGKRWIEFLLAKREHWDEWKEHYYSVIDTLDEAVSSSPYSNEDKNAMMDQNRLLAVAVVTLQLMNSCFSFEIDVTSVMKTITKSVYDQLDGNSKPVNALKQIVSYILSNRKSYFHPDSTTGKLHGVIHPNQILAIRLQTLEHILKENGYNRSVIDQWNEMGILNSESKKVVTYHTKISEGHRERMVQFKWEELQKYLGNDFCVMDDILSYCSVKTSTNRNGRPIVRFER